jgi:hypothetical protein
MCHIFVTFVSKMHHIFVTFVAKSVTFLLPLSQKASHFCYLLLNVSQNMSYFINVSQTCCTCVTCVTKIHHSFVTFVTKYMSHFIKCVTNVSYVTKIHHIFVTSQNVSHFLTDEVTDDLTDLIK